ncbi:AN1-type zinc finger protein 5-like [Grus japonensis]|uniref:AN1-type zinc finger protein 5-like n=1 Tax=Grus japonensis TaxID=30415 RepID=A0ABC9W1A4_GRUJA
MVRQAVPPQHFEVRGGADIHVQPTEDPMPEEVDASKGDYDPMGTSCLSKLLTGPVALWTEEPTPEQLRNGSDKAALVGTWPPAKVNPPQIPKKAKGGVAVDIE